MSFRSQRLEDLNENWQNEIEENEEEEDEE